MTPSPTATKTALVIGATGSFGAHAAQALIKHGWTVRALARNPDGARAKAGARTPIDWVKGDAMDAASVVAAAAGTQLIVHAVNPPGYHDWKGLVLPMTESSIAAAKATGARIAVPGNVYNYAPDAGASIGEDHVQRPITRKGKIRVEMEERLRRASIDEGVKVLILRAGDFYGPAAPNSGLKWMTMGSKGRVTRVFSPGPADNGHDYAYLPDLGETLALLADAEERLAPYEVFHFRGHYLARNGELGAAIRKVTGNARLPLTPFPWIVVQAAAPFVEMFRELLEMRYLWRRPIGLDNAKLVRFLGEEPHTPLETALRATLADMGMLDGPQAARQTAISRSSSAMAPTM